MVAFPQRLRAFLNDRWLVFVCATWIQSWGGIGYLYGSMSPVIKSTMGYNQREIALLGVAKDLGDAVGFAAGGLSFIFPAWGINLVGSIHDFLGYGFIWLVITNKWTSVPLWVLCIAIYIGTNGETFTNTADLTACVRNFPRSRGSVVGILKGFNGLSGAIATQLYLMLNTSNEASLILMVALAPPAVTLLFMAFVRPVAGHKQVRPSDGKSFLFVYSVCFVLAGYILVVLLLEDLVGLQQTAITALAVILLAMIALPIIVPIILVFFSEKPAQAEEPLLPESSKQEEGESGTSSDGVVLSEVEDEKPPEIDSLPASERHQRIAQVQAKLLQAAAEGAVRIKGKPSPLRGENITLLQSFGNIDLWLLFLSLMLAAGSGLTVIDNMGQIAKALSYPSSNVFVALFSISNFLGRIVGGYSSEIILRNLQFPRPIAQAAFQIIMAVGLFYACVGFPGQIYVLSLLIGLGYGSHWAILPATVSELFGLRNFGFLYNFLTLANPAGALIFSGIIASGIYDYYAAKQAQNSLGNHAFGAMGMMTLGKKHATTCTGTVCYSLTFGILSGLCLVAAVLCVVVFFRTKSVYAQLYGRSQA